MQQEDEVDSDIDFTKQGISAGNATSAGTVLDQDQPEDNPAHRITYSTVTDVVGGKFRVRSDAPLPENDSLIARAFVAEPLKVQDDGFRGYYALVFHRGPFRLPVINMLKTNNLAQFIAPLAGEVTFFSGVQEQRFIVILPRPPGVTLGEYLQSKGPCQESFLVQNLLPPLNAIIKVLTDLGIMHGRINLENVFVDEGERVWLGECVSEFPGYSQPSFYEPLERAVALPIGKGEGDRATDFFALGILCLAAIMGREPFISFDEEQLLNQRISRGSFNAIVGDLPLTGRMADLFRGLLNDRRTERWKNRQITDWMKGKRYNLLSPAGHVEASRQLIFNEVPYLSCRALAHDLHRHWEIAKKFLTEDKLIKWVERSISSTETAERLRQIQKLAIGVRNFIDEDEFVARTLIVLEPEGPIRLKDFIVSINGIDNVIAYSFVQGKRDYLQYIAKIINAHLPSLWLEGKGDIKYLGNSQNAWKLEHVPPFLTEKTLGFGLERCLYELNPALPCLSKVVGGDYIISLAGIMKSLELHIKDFSDNELLDRHLAAFIASKLSLASPIKIKISSQYKQIEEHRLMQMLSLLAMAQKTSRLKKLTNISHFLGEKLGGIVGCYAGKKIREELLARIQEVSKSGDMIELFKVMTDVSYSKRDHAGFQAAVLRYEDLDRRILQYQNKQSILDMGYRYGLQISVMLSYLILVIVFLILLMGFI